MSFFAFSPHNITPFTLARALAMVYANSIVSTGQRRAPERGARIDGFVRERWARWLRGILTRSSIRPMSLACKLAVDQANVQRWPRALVFKWLNAEVTVSARNAYEAGSALWELGARVSGPEAVFAAGHVPAFIGFLDLFAIEKEHARDAAWLAVLPWAAYAFGTMASFDTMHVEGNIAYMLPVSKSAFAELRQLSSAEPEFCKVWFRYQQGKRPRRQAATYYDHAIDCAYRAAAEPGIPPDRAADVAFSYLADWLPSLHLSSADFHRLWKYVKAYEEYQSLWRWNFRAAGSRFQV
jgi:hypothetical protein